MAMVPLPDSTGQSSGDLNEGKSPEPLIRDNARANLRSKGGSREILIKSVHQPGFHRVKRIASFYSDHDRNRSRFRFPVTLFHTDYGERIRVPVLAVTIFSRHIATTNEPVSNNLHGQANNGRTS